VKTSYVVEGEKFGWGESGKLFVKKKKGGKGFEAHECFTKNCER